MIAAPQNKDKYFMTVSQHLITGEVCIEFDSKPEGVDGRNLLDCLKKNGGAWSMTSRMWKLDKDLVHVFDDKEFKVYMRAMLSGASYTINWHEEGPPCVHRGGAEL